MRSLRHLTIVLATVAVVTGCGGSDEPATEATPTTPAATTPASTTAPAATTPAATTPAAPTAPTSDSGDSRAATVLHDQQQKAKSSELQTGVKYYVNAIEACAASNTDGSYTGCLDRTRLTSFEPELAKVPGTVTITPGADNNSYSVRVASNGVSFAELHDANYRITKTCEPIGAPLCDDGRWG